VNFQAVYSVASLNVFLFAMVIQKYGFTIAYVYIIVFQVLGILSMYYSGDMVH
jgi:hypothetical protein